MTLAEKLKWTRSSDVHLESVNQLRTSIASKTADQEGNHYFLTGSARRYAQCCYLEGDRKKTREAAKQVVQSLLDYFYGDWRQKQPTPTGQPDPNYWRKKCLWFEVVAEGLPWACALGDWKAVRKIAEYPIDEAFPEAQKARGETAWLRALIYYLRDDPPETVEAFLKKAEDDKAKRPKLLVPVLRALLKNDRAKFEPALLAYLAYYRKSEFKKVLGKVLALDGTMLFHVGLKHGFEVNLPEDVADHVIRL